MKENDIIETLMSLQKHVEDLEWANSHLEKRLDEVEKSLY